MGVLEDTAAIGFSVVLINNAYIHIIINYSRLYHFFIGCFLCWWLGIFYETSLSRL